MSTIAGECVVVGRQSLAAGNPRLLAALLRRGVTARFASPAELWRDAAVGLPSPAAGPSLVVPRLPSGTPAEALWALCRWERRGVSFVNRPSALVDALEKHACLAALADAGLPVPPTLAVMREAAVRLDELPGERFVVKPARASSGHGVTVGLLRGEAEAAARAFADASGPVLVQPLLGDGADRRLFVVGGRIAAAMERRPGPTGRGNLRYGARARAFDPSPRETELALAAAAVLGLDVAGVDLLAGPDGPLVLEVNACPGLAGIEAATGCDVAGALADLCLERLAPR